MHLIDLFNDNLCFYTFLKQLNFFADIPVRGHSGPLHAPLFSHMHIVGFLKSWNNEADQTVVVIDWACDNGGEKYVNIEFRVSVIHRRVTNN